MKTTADHRAVAFIDGQNLFHAAREAFGYRFPNYDAQALAGAVCRIQGWDLQQTRFYTGMPDAGLDPTWHHFWAHKLAHMGRQKVWTFSRPLRHRIRVVRLSDGSEQSYETREEKGIDVRLALDVVRLAHRREMDVALIFSQDQDLSEVAVELRAIAREQGRWLKAVSAYPHSTTSMNTRGINMTDWVRIDRATYDQCLDPRDYRPKAGNA